MSKSWEDLQAKLTIIPEEEPDAMDRAMIAQAQAVDDDSAAPLEEVKSALEYSGKLNIRIPKTLHCQLSREAKMDGVSLNQYIIYKLAR